MKNIFSNLLKKLKQPYKNVCPVCSKSKVEFLPLPSLYKDEAIKYGYKYYGMGEMTSLETYSCSECGASDRERLYAFWISEKIKMGQLAKGAKMIHFAPEAELSKKLVALNFFDYITADYGMDVVDYKIDITHMPTIASDQFDFFICSHVLEHVENDDKAIQELYRITKNGGFGILMAPIIKNLEHTLEDPALTTKAQRWQSFGQDDHLRLYAHDDYVEKITSNGFVLEQLGVEHFGIEVFAKLGLKDSSILYIAIKNN